MGSSDIIATTDLLNAPAERLAHVDRLWDLVKVPVTPDEEVKGQGQLRERAAGHAFNEWLIVDFEEAVSASAWEPDDMPLVHRDALSAPASTQRALVLYLLIELFAYCTVDSIRIMQPAVYRCPLATVSQTMSWFL